jgi:phosphate acetyltransferase
MLSDVAPDALTRLREKARRAPQRVVLPESDEENILRAARAAADGHLAVPVLLGEPGALARSAGRHGIDLSGIEILDVTDEAVLADLASTASRSFPSMSPRRIDKKLRDPLGAGALLVATGWADALVAGLLHTTQEVIVASMSFIDLQEGVSKPASFFLMRVPGFDGPQGELIVFADCGVTVSPDAPQLAEIAILTARAVRALLEWEPRVALLSFSTKASGYDESVKRVREALTIGKEREPGLAIDGELQLDAAIIPAVAARKAPGEELVAGSANILIFPDLNSGNIAYKCVQRFAQADAFGPFFLGLTKTASDLSRGSSVADILGVITMASVHAQYLKQQDEGSLPPAGDPPRVGGSAPASGSRPAALDDGPPSGGHPRP